MARLEVSDFWGLVSGRRESAGLEVRAEVHEIEGQVPGRCDRVRQIGYRSVWSVADAAGFSGGKNKMRRLRPFAVILVLVVSVGALVASGSDNKAAKVDEKSGKTDTSGKAAESFKVGDAVALGDLQVKVYAFTDPVQVAADSPVKPDEGFRRVKLDAEVANKGDKAVTVSSILCFELKDGENKVYDQTIGDSKVGSIDGEVAPGAALRGEIEYDVPAASKGFVLNFKCDLLSSGSATITLS